MLTVISLPLRLVHFIVYICYPSIKAISKTLSKIPHLFRATRNIVFFLTVFATLDLYNFDTLPFFLSQFCQIWRMLS